MNEGLTDDLFRELYARYGLAYFHGECLHRGLCIIFALSSLPRRDLITRPRVEERLAYAFSLTLGDVTGKLQGVLPAEQFRELQQVVPLSQGSCRLRWSAQGAPGKVFFVRAWADQAPPEGWGHPPHGGVRFGKC